MLGGEVGSGDGMGLGGNIVSSSFERVLVDVRLSGRKKCGVHGGRGGGERKMPMLFGRFLFFLTGRTWIEVGGGRGGGPLILRALV
jgi:hypothetical protein